MLCFAHFVYLPHFARVPVYLCCDMSSAADVEWSLTRPFSLGSQEIGRHERLADRVAQRAADLGRDRQCVLPEEAVLSVGGVPHQVKCQPSGKHIIFGVMSARNRHGEEFYLGFDFGFRHHESTPEQRCLTLM